jgi:hypothetical protein
MNAGGDGGWVAREESDHGWALHHYEDSQHCLHERA